MSDVAKTARVARYDAHAAAGRAGYREQTSVSFPFWRRRAVGAILRREAERRDVRVLERTKFRAYPILVVRARRRVDILTIAQALAELGHVVVSPPAQTGTELA
ncbi:MAG: hypothetical protein ABW026_06455 [Microvirga sp.]